jgi:purine-binding chemotaxis protein CheW
MIRANIAAQPNQLIVFKVRDEVFATNISEVREIIRLEEITPVPNSNDYIKGLVSIRGKIVPVIELGIILNIGSNLDHEQFILLIETTDAGMVGMLVNEVVEVKRISLEEIKEAPKLIKSKISAEFVQGVVLPEESGEEDDIILFVDLKAIISKSVVEVIDQVKNNQEKVGAAA